MDANPVSSRSRPEASPQLLVALFGLTFVTGVIDAVSFLGLGHVFTANMTGNVVLLGFALGGTGGMSVGRSFAALVAFGSGSVIGGRLTNRRQRSPAAHLLIAMCAEVGLLSLAAGAALITSGAMSIATVYLLIVLTAVAMGLRNAVVRKLAVADLTTTVLTMTVTGLSADSSLAGGTSPSRNRRMLAILAMCTGAVIGAMLVRVSGMWGPFLVATLAVSGFASYLYLSERQRSHIRSDSQRRPDATSSSIKPWFKEPAHVDRSPENGGDRDRFTERHRVPQKWTPTQPRNLRVFSEFD